MYTKYPKIKRDDIAKTNVSTYGNIGDLALRINSAYVETPKEVTWDPLHHHKTSTVFIVVLEGVITLQIDGHNVDITPEAIVQIDPLTPYKVTAIKEAPARYVFIGTKNIEGDRVVVEE